MPSVPVPGDLPTERDAVRLSPEVRQFYERYARGLGISTETLIILVLVGVKTVLQSERDGICP